MGKLTIENLKINRKTGLLRAGLFIQNQLNAGKSKKEKIQFKKKSKRAEHGRADLFVLFIL